MKKADRRKRKSFIREFEKSGLFSLNSFLRCPNGK